MFMRIWQTDVSVEKLNERSVNTMAAYLGIEFTMIGEDFMVARMPVDHRTKQPMGIMHGGASCVLAETVGSTAANCCVNLEESYCVGLDINTNHIHSIQSGYVIGTARPFHLGKSTQVWGIEIKDELGQWVSINRLTMAVLKRR
jgi:1,4-dihydroxy-2-naphthoyl-CoA hydrolase